MEEKLRLKLKKLRKDMGYTQKSFAKELKVSHKTIEHIEQGRRFPTEHLLLKIMKTLSTTDISIFENTQNENLKRGDITKAISDYMNKTGKTGKKYTAEVVKILRASTLTERKDREQNELAIRSYSECGKIEIFKRVARIANERLLKDKINFSIAPYDVKLFKVCTRLEFEERTGKTTWSKIEERRRKGCSSRTGKFIDV